MDFLLFHEVAQGALEGGFAQAEFGFDDGRRRLIAIRHLALALLEEVQDAFGIGIDGIFLGLAQGDVDAAVFAQVSDAAFDHLADEDRPVELTAVQEGDPPFAGHEVSPLVGHIVDRPFDPVANFSIRRCSRRPAHFVFHFHGDGQAMGFVFIELDPDVFPFFRPAFHFGKGHEDAPFRADIDEGTETRRIDDRRIADLADFDLRKAHGSRQAA